MKHIKILGSKIWIVECLKGICWPNSRRAEETKKSLANDKLKLLVWAGCQKLVWATVRIEQGYTLSTQQPMARKNQNSMCPGKADKTGDHVLISFVIGRG